MENSSILLREKASKLLERKADELHERKVIKNQRADTIVNGQSKICGFRIMDADAEQILQIILDLYDGNESREVEGDYKKIPIAYHGSLGLQFEKLVRYGMIVSPYTYPITSWDVTLTLQGLAYFEDKKAAQERDRMDREKVSVVNIENLTSHGGNIFLAPVTNSTFSIDNSVSNIEKEIEEKAGEDAEELKAVLDEVKELIENINDSRHIPKNKGLLQRITGHLDKHGWFYAEIIGLLGTAAMALLGG